MPQGTEEKKKKIMVQKPKVETSVGKVGKLQSNSSSNPVDKIGRLPTNLGTSNPLNNPSTDKIGRLRIKRPSAAPGKK